MNNERQKRFCKYCGAEITESTKICKNCGSLISKEQNSKILDYLNSDVGNGNGMFSNTSSNNLFSKLKTCKTCGSQIARNAKSCPHCGANASGQIAIGISVGIVCFVCFALFFNGISSTSSKAKTTQANSADVSAPEQSYDVPSSRLLADYDNNEVDADNKYKGYLLNVSGYVQSVSVVLGDTAVLIDNGETMNITMVQCNFKSQEEIDKVSKLKKGQRVTIQGRCSGKSIYIHLNDCKVIKQ